MSINKKSRYIKAANQILFSLGFPRAQQNKRSALCLLALLNLTPGKPWLKAENPLIGITPIMDWVREHYGIDYKPNTRETFRRKTMHQFVDAGIALYNPDKPDRPVNSPKAVYQIESAALTLLNSYGTPEWHDNLIAYLAKRETLAARYAKEREQNRIPVEIAPGKQITLSPGEHSELIRAIILNFAPRFAPGGVLVYVGDTGDKWGYFDAPLLSGLGVDVDSHGKMPDVLLHYAEKNWLLLVESVTSHGPVDGKRHDELAKLFAKSSAGLVYVTAFPSRAIMSHYLGEIAWETEVWVADAPSHLIHFNGERFLGPYDENNRESPRFISQKRNKE
jgi:BsuBI/PstI restriction endonuclease domain/BsuBI/PstI restriction endonuclease HTH domain